MNKKAGISALSVVAVILALTVLAVFLVNIAQRECHSNRDCPDNAYCNTIHKCIEYPDKVLVKENNFLPAAIVLGIALIVSTYIYKGGKIPFRKKKD